MVTASILGIVIGAVFVTLAIVCKIAFFVTILQTIDYLTYSPVVTWNIFVSYLLYIGFWYVLSNLSAKITLNFTEKNKEE